MGPFKYLRLRKFREQLKNLNTDSENTRNLVQEFVCAEFGMPKLEPWKGYQYFWHVYHRGSLAHIRTYDNYRARLVAIILTKPITEWAVRFKLMQPVKTKTAGDFDNILYDIFGEIMTNDAVIRLHNEQCPNCSWEWNMGLKTGHLKGIGAD
jgi:hypothetical protein